jgi:hypothetical protein
VLPTMAQTRTARTTIDGRMLATTAYLAAVGRTESAAVLEAPITVVFESHRGAADTLITAFALLRDAFCNCFGCRSGSREFCSSGCATTS